MRRIARFFKFLYLKLFRINDTPQKIAAGVGLGVFLGIMPFAGPVIALFFAFILRVNRAAAFLGSLLTNTWLTIPLFFVAVKIGSVITGADYLEIQREWQALYKDFSWAGLLKLSVDKAAIPFVLGYLVIALVTAMIAYIVTVLTLSYAKRKKTAGPSKNI